MHSSQRTPFRPDIEGLRGLAIILVVLFHAGVSMVRGAFVAVDVFFVLSGFFLTSALAREVADNRWSDLTGFYAKRMLRLLPMLILVLLATLASVMTLYAPIDRADVAASIGPAAFFGSNFSFATAGVNYFSASENPLLHTWSLGVEQQFHLVWPLLLVLFAWIAVRRSRNVSTTVDEKQRAVRGMVFGVAITALLSLVVSIAFSKTAPMWSYFGPHTRLWEFALGGAAAMLVGAKGFFGDNRRAAAIAQGIGLVAIIAAALLFDRTMPYPGFAALLPAIGATSLVIVGTGGIDTPVGRLLSIAPLQSLGRVSYAWYLWHWPVMVLGGMLVLDIGVVGQLVAGAIALVLAWITQRVVEQPMRYGALARKPAGTVFIGATVASALVALIGYGAQRHAERQVASSVHGVFAAARNDRMSHSCWARSVDALPSAPCVFGDASSPTTFALLGDSHAEHWLAGLDRAGREHGWRIVANVMGGCPVADFSRLTSGATTRRYLECSRYRDNMLERIMAQRPAAVILSSWDHYVPSLDRERSDFHVDGKTWTNGLRQTYQRLTSAGIPVVVIRGTPRTWFDVPTCLSRKAARLPFATDCTYEYDERFIRTAQRAQDVAARGLPVRFIDMNDQICATKRCPTVRNDIVMFTDDNHLTASFTRSLGPVLGQRLSAIFTPQAAPARTLRSR